MSKALVIKGANFHGNAVEKITIYNPVPCTGVTLNKNNIGFATIGATETLTTTLSPSDTTEQPIWASSNTDVATVDDGVVTCTGIGTATITVTCGEQIATCEVTSTETINLNTKYSHDDGYAYSAVQLPDKNWIGRSNANGEAGRLYYDSNDALGGYRAFYLASNAGKYLMPIPAGARTATLTTEDTWRFEYIILADSHTKSNQGGADGQCAAAVAISSTGQIDISEYPTANGFIVSLIAFTGESAASKNGAVTVTFS